MPFKLIATGDWHVDHVTRGVARAQEIEAAVHESVRAAVEGRADAYLFLGDLCDPDNGPATLRAIEFAAHVALTLSRQGVRSIWIAGNHDVCNDGEGTTTLTPLRPLTDQTRDGGAVHLHEGPAKLAITGWPPALLLPFTEPAHGYDPAAFVERRSDGAIVLGHLGVEGIIPGEETTELPRGRDVLFPAAKTTKALLRMNGHIHKRQSFDPGDGGPPIEIPGSLAALTFGEERNVPGFLTIEVP